MHEDVSSSVLTDPQNERSAGRTSSLRQHSGAQTVASHPHCVPSRTLPDHSAQGGSPRNLPSSQQEGRDSGGVTGKPSPCKGPETARPMSAQTAETSPTTPRAAKAPRGAVLTGSHVPRHPVPDCGGGAGGASSHAQLAGRGGARGHILQGQEQTRAKLSRNGRRARTDGQEDRAGRQPRLWNSTVRDGRRPRGGSPGRTGGRERLEG